MIPKGFKNKQHSQHEPTLKRRVETEKTKAFPVSGVLERGLRTLMELGRWNEKGEGREDQRVAPRAVDVFTSISHLLSAVTTCTQVILGAPAKQATSVINPLFSIIGAHCCADSSWQFSQPNTGGSSS